MVNGKEPIVLRNDNEPFSIKPTALAPKLGKEYGSSIPEGGHLTVWLVLTAITCFLGSSFQFGYNLGVVNAPKDVGLLFIEYIFIAFRCI